MVKIYRYGGDLSIGKGATAARGLTFEKKKCNKYSTSEQSVRNDAGCSSRSSTSQYLPKGARGEDCLREEL
jgi:hypothetical protein